MKKSTIIILAAIVLLVIAGVSAYNGLVSKEEGVKNAWSNVENQYQRRSDLIPNLVNTVKGYAAHEQRVSVAMDDLTPEKLQAYQEAQGEVGRALGRLLAISENYPELKANENFKELQAQLEGTENRIAVERRKFNETVRQYNTSIRKFPLNLFAAVFGFEQSAYFEAEESSREVPEVAF